MKVGVDSKYSNASKLFEIEKIIETMAINYGLSFKVNILILDREMPSEMTNSNTGFDIRSTVLLGKSTELSILTSDIDIREDDKS